MSEVPVCSRAIHGIPVQSAARKQCAAWKQDCAQETRYQGGSGGARDLLALDEVVHPNPLVRQVRVVARLPEAHVERFHLHLLVYLVICEPG